ncbi:hypothetical protein [Crocosphaera chwakensis]|uniref:hypothetical protein n=1 Tax=Crocosphaera chwakensis TaxID=2546361 RepID=UPI000A04C4A5|nr:hypothetical protein [Crocosphaera chwakensis]
MNQDSMNNSNDLVTTESIRLDEKPTYKEKTERINAITGILNTIKPFLLILFCLIVLSWAGKYLMNYSISQGISELNSSNNTEFIITVPEKKDIDEGIVIALKQAKTNAENFASAELDEWINQLMTRVDDSFLPWYFGYFNQKYQELRTPFLYLKSAVSHWVNSKSPSPNQAVAKQLTEEMQREFAKRVLQPKLSQLQLENITRNTANVYVDSLSNNLANLQSHYNIPQAEWEKYLHDLAVTIKDAEGNVSSLSMKLLVVGSPYLFAKAMIPLSKGGIAMLSLAGKSGAKMAAKTGGITATKIGAQFIDPLIVFGIMIWDLWDYHHTVSVDKPILRNTIELYLQEVKEVLLENSVMSSIYQVENGILKAL